MTCLNCNKTMPRYQCKTRTGKYFLVPHKYCPECNPFDHETDKFRFENYARTMANEYPERINIVYECPCEAKKLKHHFDYEYSYDIFLLCQKCHNEEHKKINRLEKFYKNRLNISIRPGKEESCSTP